LKSAPILLCLKVLETSSHFSFHFWKDLLVLGCFVTLRFYVTTTDRGKGASKMQTFPEKFAETGSAGHPFVAFDMALWMHLPLVNSQFCFSLSLVTSCLCFQNLLS
jgi:hypothetical protein